MQLIILDRDGVLNQDSDAYVKSVDEWLPIPGSAEAVGNSAGRLHCCRRDESASGTRLFFSGDLDAMHDKMTGLAAAEGGEFAHIAFCPHGPDDGCDCRKPLPGLIHQIEEALEVSAEGAWMVGDSIRDLEAGAAAGCKTALVRTGKGEKSEYKLTSHPTLADAPVFEDLATFVDWLIAQQP